ncbi:MAG: hypothetical protein JWP17_2067 [Solirubrobacterales bacterium]|nr:hypothetical protein [Solirubrobacterales bacterium]
MTARALTVVTVALLALAGMAVSAGGASARKLALVPSYAIASGAPGSELNANGWTYDSAVSAAADAASGALGDAATVLDELQRLQRADGALYFSYDLRSGRGNGVMRSGSIAWVGLAAAQYRLATCSHRYDDLLAGVAGWLLAQRVDDPSAPGYGLVRGGPGISWISAEHNLEVRAFAARLVALVAGQTRCDGGLTGMDGARVATAISRTRAAVDLLDAGIQRDLFVTDGPGRAHFRQGVGDDARPVDVQAYGIEWLIGQGRLDDARAVAAQTQATTLVSDRTIEGRPAAGTFTGYRPFADAWSPDVLWMEGTMQMRMALADLGLPTADLDSGADRWAAATGGGRLFQADRTVVGHHAGDFHVWAAAAPAAWRTLAASGTTLLQ